MQRLTWDDEDQLLEIRDRRGITRFDYDPLGRRIGKHHQPNNAHPRQLKPISSTHTDHLGTVQELSEKTAPLSQVKV